MIDTGVLNDGVFGSMSFTKGNAKLMITFVRNIDKELVTNITYQNYFDYQHKQYKFVLPLEELVEVINAKPYESLDKTFKNMLSLMDQAEKDAA